MSHFGVAMEYGLHVMLRLAGPQGDVPPSVKALAEFQGIPSAYLSKIMTQLEKAGLVVASEGKRGGYRLARPPAQISFLDVADAIEGSKRLFECTEIRRRCVLYGDAPPKAAVSGICAIHAAMLAAERRMRDHLAKTTLADIARSVRVKIPPELSAATQRWFADHASKRFRRLGRSKVTKRSKAKV